MSDAPATQEGQQPGPLLKEEILWALSVSPLLLCFIQFLFYTPSSVPAAKSATFYLGAMAGAVIGCLLCLVMARPRMRGCGRQAFAAILGIALEAAWIILLVDYDMQGTLTLVSSLLVGVSTVGLLALWICVSPRSSLRHELGKYALAVLAAFVLQMVFNGAINLGFLSHACTVITTVLLMVFQQRAGVGAQATAGGAEAGAWGETRGAGARAKDEANEDVTSNAAAGVGLAGGGTATSRRMAPSATVGRLAVGNANSGNPTTGSATDGRPAVGAAAGSPAARSGGGASGSVASGAATDGRRVVTATSTGDGGSASGNAVYGRSAVGSTTGSLASARRAHGNARPRPVSAALTIASAVLVALLGAGFAVLGHGGHHVEYAAGLLCALLAVPLLVRSAPPLAALGMGAPPIAAISLCAAALLDSTLPFVVLAAAACSYLVWALLSARCQGAGGLGPFAPAELGGVARAILYLTLCLAAGFLAASWAVDLSGCTLGQASITLAAALVAGELCWRCTLIAARGRGGTALAWASAPEVGWPSAGNETAGGWGATVGGAHAAWEASLEPGTQLGFAAGGAGTAGASGVGAGYAGASYAGAGAGAAASGVPGTPGTPGSVLGAAGVPGSAAPSPSQADLDAIFAGWGLSPREAQVGRLLYEGQSLDGICQALEMAEGTAKTHVRHIYEKSATHSKVEFHIAVNQQLGQPR